MKDVKSFEKTGDFVKILYEDGSGRCVRISKVTEIAFSTNKDRNSDLVIYIGDNPCNNIELIFEDINKKDKMINLLTGCSQ